jgi:plastocyanin domain-containing protein
MDGVLSGNYWQVEISISKGCYQKISEQYTLFDSKQSAYKCMNEITNKIVTTFEKQYTIKVNDKFLDRLGTQDIFLLDNNGKVFKAISLKITKSCYPDEISIESLIRKIKETQNFIRCHS